MGKFKPFLCGLAVIGMTHSCAAPGVLKGPGVGMPPFSYSLLDHDGHNLGSATDDNGRGNAYAYGRKEKIGDLTVETIEVNGERVRFVENQVEVTLRDDSQLERLLEKYSAKVIERIAVQDGPVIEVNEDSEKTTGEVATPVKPHEVIYPDLKDTNTYILELVPSETDSVEDLADNGLKAGFNGNWNFFSAEAAFLCAKVARMVLDDEFDLETVSLNLIHSSSGSFTTEGRSIGNDKVPLSIAPQHKDFHWTAPENYLSPQRLSFSHTVDGANIFDPDAKIYSGDINLGIRTSPYRQIRVAVLDQGFNGGKDGRLLPAPIVRMVELVYDAGVPTRDPRNSRKLNPDSMTIQNKPNPTGPEWHGRKVASLIFAPQNDQAGTFGLAPMAKPILVHLGATTSATIYKGLRFAIDNKADVINMSIEANGHLFSFVGPFRPAYVDLLEEATKKNILLVAAAGNHGDNGATLPAAYSNVIGVGSRDQYGRKAYFANSHYSNSINVDIWAPGVEIPVAPAPLGTAGRVRGASPFAYTSRDESGTSYSAPIVAGTLALARGQGFANNASQAHELLTSNAYSTSKGGYRYIALNVLDTIRKKRATAPKPLPRMAIPYNPFVPLYRGNFTPWFRAASVGYPTPSPSPIPVPTTVPSPTPVPTATPTSVPTSTPTPQSTPMPVNPVRLGLIRSISGLVVDHASNLFLLGLDAPQNSDVFADGRLIKITPTLQVVTPYVVDSFRPAFDGVLVGDILTIHEPYSYLTKIDVLNGSIVSRSPYLSSYYSSSVANRAGKIVYTNSSYQNLRIFVENATSVLSDDTALLNYNVTLPEDASSLAPRFLEVDDQDKPIWSSGTGIYTIAVSPSERPIQLYGSSVESMVGIKSNSSKFLVTRGDSNVYLWDKYSSTVLQISTSFAPFYPVRLHRGLDGYFYVVAATWYGPNRYAYDEFKVYKCRLEANGALTVLQTAVDTTNLQ